MTSRDFCYWLQGYFEVSGHRTKSNPPAERLCLDQNQVECVQRHLEMVFKHEIDPSFPDLNSLRLIHDKPKIKLDELPIMC